MKTTLDKKIILSTLWIFLSVNYIFCDVLSNMEASALNALLTGEIAGIILSEKFLLFAAISLEIPFLMILLSRITPYKLNRVLNLIAPTLMIVYQLGSMFVGTAPTLHYMFFSTVEVLGNLAILIVAFKWKSELA